MVRDEIRRRLAPHPRLFGLARRAGMVARFAARRPHEPDFAWFAGLEGDGLFLDVGANSGQSALSFRIFNRSHRILSVEANPALEPDLRFVKRLISGFDYRMVALSDTPGETVLRVPHRGTTPLSQAASLDGGFITRRADEIRRRSGGEFHVVEVPVEVTTVDALAVEPSVVKIDVEGGEHRVLRGMQETIERRRPVVLLEVWRADAGSQELLLDHGYGLFTIAGGEARPWSRGEPALNVLALPGD